MEKITCWERQNLAAEQVQSRNPWAEESSLQLSRDSRHCCHRSLRHRDFVHTQNTSLKVIPVLGKTCTHVKHSWQFTSERNSLPQELFCCCTAPHKGKLHSWSQSLTAVTGLSHNVQLHPTAILFAHSHSSSSCGESWITAWDPGAGWDEGDLQKR